MKSGTELYSGKVVNMLTLLNLSDRAAKHAYWVCLCECGETKDIRADVLRAGKQKSCGCQLGAPTHRMSRVPIYWLWQNMIRRCTDPKNHAYKDYGGRGISVCDRWRSFDNFFADMGEKPAGASLDRIDNNLGYSPENCRWATWKTQHRNRRTNKYIEIDGVTRTLAEWCEIYHQPYPRILRRIKFGMSPKAALSETRDLRYA